MPMKLNTANTVNVMSMFDIFIHLQSINKQSHDEESTRSCKSNPKSLLRKRIGYKVTYNHKPHHKLAYIIAILGEVVYLLLFQHGNTKIAMDVP